MDMGEKPFDVSDDELERLVKEEKRVVVDFWAPWCAPCRVISPIVEEMAGKYRDGYTFVKLNIDNNPDSPIKYSIMGVPTLLFFKEGELIDRIVGVVPQSRIEGTIAEMA